MSPKNLALIAAAVAVMAMGLYLFIQVKATPAQAHVPAQATNARPSPVPERSPADTAPTPPPTPTPAPTPSRSAPSGTPTLTSAVQAGPDVASAEDEGQRANPRLDSMMELANKAYDAQEFDQATAIASKVLAKDPTNVRMLRIMVSANCIGGDSGIAQQYYEKLPKFDRDQMKTRCDRYGVTFTEPQQ